MADFTSLNGYTVKDPYALHSYDSVADLKADTKLKAGYHVKTKGYATAGDGGQATYIIVDDNTLIDDGGSIHQLNNGLKAVIDETSEINVKQFGAKGDGTTNDTQAFASATAKGLDIYVPAGTYMVSSIVLAQNETIRGEGWAKTFIKSIANNTQTAIITCVENAMRTQIRDLAIHGNRDNNANVIDGIHLYKTTSGNDTHAFINNVRTSFCSGNGIKMTKQLESRISHCVANNNALNGIIYVNTSDAVIEDTTCSSNDQNGIRITTGANRIVNCKCFYNGFNGTLGYTDTRYSGFYIGGANNTINSCHAQENAAHGIELGESNEITITGCCVDNNGLYFDENRSVIPLPEGVDPIYDGIHANHVRRSYIEVCGRNFHLSNGSSQRTTLCFEDESECGLNTFVVSSGNQLVKDFEMNDATKCHGTVNGIVVETPVNVGYRFIDNTTTLGALTSDSNYPISFKEENGYIHVTGAVGFENEITTEMGELTIIKVTDETKYNTNAIFGAVQAFPTSLYSDPKGLINFRMSTDGSIKVRNRGSLTGIQKVVFDFTYRPVNQEL